ncbi:MAG: hypothetical protein DMG59_27545 [Acidobacteria bacterium]|nr:MAG: hypothetical protein DMG59_27545 [Acidobacteriota bacterium]
MLTFVGENEYRWIEGFLSPDQLTDRILPSRALPEYIVGIIVRVAIHDHPHADVVLLHRRNELPADFGLP